MTEPTTAGTWLGGLADRAVRTALQTLAAYMTVATQFDEVNWAVAASAVALAVILSVLTSLISLPSFGESWAFQVMERAVKTFAQNLVTFIGTAAVLTDVNWSMALDMALYAALYSVVSSTLTTRAGDPDTKGQVDVKAPTPAVRRVG